MRTLSAAAANGSLCGGGGLGLPKAMLLLLLISFSCLAAAGSTSCVKGRVTLTTTADRPWCREGGDDNDCVLDFDFQFDSEAPSGSRWPLNAWVGSNSKNRTALSSLFPELIDVAFQCSTTGDVLATTRSGTNGERLRFMWRYTGVSSFSCAYTFSSVDLIEDFTQFTALLAYSGRVSTFDASYTSISDVYSIGKLSSAANCPLVPVATAGGGSASTTTSGGAGGGGGGGSSACTISDCRHPLSAWKSKPLKSSATWKAIQHKALCGISYRDLIFESGGEIRRMGANWLDDARELIICELNAAQSACPLPVGLSYVAELASYLQNPLNCGQNTLHADWLSSLRSWNDQTLVCDMLKASGGGSAGEDGAGDGSSVHAAARVKRRDMIIIIVVSVTAGTLCLILMGCCCLFLCCAPLRTLVFGFVPVECCGISCGFLLGCLGLLKPGRHPLKEDDGLRRYADPNTMEERIIRLPDEEGPRVPVFEALLSAGQPGSGGLLGVRSEIVTAAHPLASFVPDAFTVVQPAKYQSGSATPGAYYTGH